MPGGKAMNFSSYFVKNNSCQRVGIIFGIIGSVIIIVLWAIIISYTKGYMFILTQVLPGAIGLISSVIKKVWLLTISFFILLPLGFYNRYLLLGVTFYLFSIVLLVIGNRIAKNKLPSSPTLENGLVLSYAKKLRPK
jgi:hypothetical protein